MQQYKLIVIGGSAGSFQVIRQILSGLRKNFEIPIIIVLHRLRGIQQGFVEILSLKSNLTIIEPHDKQEISAGKAYIAPANYHLYIESPGRISLSTEEEVNFCRPSIDVTFISAAQVFSENLIGIILSGANNDGAMGLKRIFDLGGLTIVQDPGESEVNIMPISAIKKTNVHHIIEVNEIIDFLNSL